MAPGGRGGTAPLASLDRVPSKPYIRSYGATLLIRVGAAADGGSGAKWSQPAIRALVADVDGCLAPVAHGRYDLGGLGTLARMHARSRREPHVPFLTLLTGRPHGYVDALTQLLDLDHPASFENGAGLAWRQPYHTEMDRRAEAGLSSLESLKTALVAAGGVVVQPGKVASLSIFPYPDNQPANVAALHDRCRAEAEALRLDLVLERSRDCVNVLVPGVDKESGFFWLLEVLGLHPDEVAGIGDSFGDAPWLRHCALSAAPLGADPAVRSVVTHPAELDDIEALLWFYRIVSNRNARRAG